MRRPLILLAALAACAPHDVWPDGYTTLRAPLWVPGGAATGGTGVLLPLPRAQQIVSLAPDGTLVGLGTESLVPSAAHALPGGRVLVTGAEVRCDEVPVTTFDGATDCDFDDLVVHDLAWVADSEGPVDLDGDGEVDLLDLPLWFGDPEVSADGRFAVASIDPSASTQGGGIVNLNSVRVLDLEAGDSWEVSVGFDAGRILFTETAEGAADGLLVLSQSEVAVVDLTAQVPVPSVTFNLTLDADQVLQPVDIALTPDRGHALLTIQGSADLYVLDLVDNRVNIVSLSGNPAAMAVHAPTDQTVIAYTGRAYVDVLDHALFEPIQVALEEGASQIDLAEDFALLSSPGSRDVVRLDLGLLRPEEYRLNFAPQRIEVAPDRSVALAFSSEGGRGRVEALDLTAAGDGSLDLDSKPFGLDAPLADVAFTTTETGVEALLLLEDSETLFALAWPELQVEEVRLPDSPVAIGRVDDGPFWITHTDPLGLVSFYTPGEPLETFGGFAGAGLMDPEGDFVRWSRPSDVVTENVVPYARGREE